MPDSSTDFTIQRLPKFGDIDPTTIAAQLETLLGRQREAIEQLVADPAAASWRTTIEPLERLQDELHRFFSPISHLNGVAETEALRAPYADCVAMISAYASELAQHPGLCACYQTIRDSEEYTGLSPAQQRVVDNALRDFRLGGVDLNDTDKEEVTRLRVELSGLATDFNQHVLDATESFRLNITSAEQLAGLPQPAMDLARHNAEQAGEKGWTLTLEFPSYLPAISHLENRGLRETLYRAFVTRASDQGPDGGKFDNSGLVDQILEKRSRLAHLLGFDDYASLSLATKMADSNTAVNAFILELASKSKAAGERELDELTTFARNNLGLDKLEPWDLNYCSEKLREHNFSFTQEDLRPYFPVSRVLSGLFEISRTVFGIDISEPEIEVDRWNDEVLFFQVSDPTEGPIAFFYLDLYARQGKRGGAWMDECLVRWSSAQGEQLPVAYLTCNFTPPINNAESLLTHDEVTTLFHEFGHGLHHMLTKITYPSVAGINGVPWDAVELPSQMLENWCWNYDALKGMSGHHKTGEALPRELFSRLDSARTFQAAMQMLRQLEFAAFDFNIHQQDFAGDVQAALDQVRKEIAVVTPPSWNRFQHSFSHIFAGGYAAGYYSYKWAEVLSADAFSRFEDEGIFNPDTGREFRQAILEQGGASDAMELFKRFRGREPEVEPLLRHAGLAA